jgi:hypothetical protein
LHVNIKEHKGENAIIYAHMECTCCIWRLRSWPLGYASKQTRTYNITLHTYLHIDTLHTYIHYIDTYLSIVFVSLPRNDYLLLREYVSIRPLIINGRWWLRSASNNRLHRNCLLSCNCLNNSLPRKWRFCTLRVQLSQYTYTDCFKFHFLMCAWGQWTLKSLYDSLLSLHTCDFSPIAAPLCSDNLHVIMLIVSEQFVEDLIISFTWAIISVKHAS